jgi:hypothetical protein
MLHKVRYFSIQDTDYFKPTDVFLPLPEDIFIKHIVLYQLRPKQTV